MQTIKTFYKTFTEDYCIINIPTLLAQLTHVFHCYI
jgi:hypothetical protein